ncbi:MAG TPA: hypothetical protein VNM14_21600 [Planctomycetota bacterium]|nr:hypothetical protein [Planctomycetota bacterium]
MGQAILYCFRCSSQLREAQFEKRKAFRVDAWVTCAACAPELLKTLPADRAAALQDLIAGKERKPSAATPPPMRDSRLSITPAAFPSAGAAAPPRPKWPLAVGVGFAVVAVLAAALMMGRGPTPSSAPPEEPRQQPPPLARNIPPPPPPPPKPAGDSPERQILKKAQQYAREHPDDLEGQLREFSDLSLLSDKTDVGSEARKAVEALQGRERQMVTQGLAALNSEIEEPLKREDFGTVNKALDAARTRISGTQWKLALERRQREIGDLVYAALQLLKEKARVAKAAGNQADVDAIVQKVKSWDEKYLETLEQAINSVEVAPPPVPEPPSRSPEAKSYLAQWELAMAKAASRDYAGAAADLERGAAAWKEDAVKQELAQDLKDLKELDRLYQAAIAAQAAAKTLALNTEGHKVSGRVLSIDADRVELVVDPGKPTVFIEWSDLGPASIVALMQAQNPEARFLTLFKLLDGAPKAFQKGIDPKYAAFAAVARSKEVKPSADELSAREIFYEAERQFRSMATRDKAVEGYRQLKQKFKDTLLVKHAAARIDRRLESGKEYYFLASDLSAGGTFSITKEGRYETLADADAAKPNWVEGEFLALPSTTYRCWALVGGCCAEAFTFHYQATGLTELNPKTKKRAPAEPGGELASPVKHSLKNLKPSHPKGEPQKPTRWEWIEIVLPRSSTAGVKQLRLLTDLKGFGVAALLVSSTKSKAPTEAEAAELTKTRALDAVPSWFASKSGGIPRLLLDDFDQGVAGWGFHNGAEFKGAKGGVVHDSAVGHDQKGSLKLSADFTGGGSYVSTGRNFPAGVDLREVRFWLKAENPAHIGIRVGDGSDQILQKPINLTATRDWQEVVLTFEKFNGAEHWGGANDGRLHTPVKGFHICVSVTTFGGAKAGDVWIDDVEGILNTDAPDK